MITKIWFVDFWAGFDPYKNYFTNLLTEFHFPFIVDHEPDVIFFSVFGETNKKYLCKKIFYTGENLYPYNFIADKYLSFDYIDRPNHFRLPLYLLYDNYYKLTDEKNIEESLSKRMFCNFIYSNPHADNRNKIFDLLSKYKKVDSGGKYNNNIGYFVSDKLIFQSNYKFSISFENQLYRYETNGYTTEKIVDPMSVNSMPIYWGNPLVHKDFNTKSFINYYDFNNEKDMIDYIIYLDQNNSAYLDKMKSPWLLENKIPDNLERKKIFNFIIK